MRNRRRSLRASARASAGGLGATLASRRAQRTRRRLSLPRLPVRRSRTAAKAIARVDRGSARPSGRRFSKCSALAVRGGRGAGRTKPRGRLSERAWSRHCPSAASTGSRGRCGMKASRSRRPGGPRVPRGHLGRIILKPIIGPLSSVHAIPTENYHVLRRPCARPYSAASQPRLRCRSRSQRDVTLLHLEMKRPTRGGHVGVCGCRHACEDSCARSRTGFVLDVSTRESQA